ncbi:hypothetical protein HYT57_04600 [Candidatus Woesearchaeota archaeon]|nr:hypothetical protein [Candidatus Woesearchaeota archaeon]
MSQDPAFREKIISFIRMNGPVLPVQISKQFGGNLFFAGAVLSELVGRQKIKISNAKVGGSPVYYIDGQEQKLHVLYDHLKDVHKKVYDLLKENKILKDRDLEAWQRVALREIKDFAHSLQNDDGIFWKWYLISDNEAIKIIKERYYPEPEAQEIPVQPVVQPMKIEEQPIAEKIVETLPQELKVQEKIQKPKPRRVQEKSDMAEDIKNYFSQKKAFVLEEKIIRKSSEIDYIADIPSNVGKVKFFVKYRNKKMISDADLVLAHNDAQLRKLPLLFLSPGELNKKGGEYMSKHFLIFEKI